MQYTNDRLNEWLGLGKTEPKNINELMLLGAKEYFTVICHITNDYVTKKYIKENFDMYYDEFYQQETTLELIEDFAGREGIEVEAVHFVLDQMKEEVIEYLQGKVSAIAQAANENV